MSRKKESKPLSLTANKKIFNELDLHHVKKVGIKRFCAQEAEMSRTDVSSLESARGKFFMNSTHIMSRKRRNQTFLRSEDRNESNRCELARIGKRKIFHELDANHI